MDLSVPDNLNKILTLQQTAEKLSVSIDTLLQWNDFNILKPTITTNGEVVYSQGQIDKFLEIHQGLLKKQIEEEKRTAPQQNPTHVQDANLGGVVFPIHPPSTPLEDQKYSNNRLFPLGLTLLLSVLLVGAILSTFIPHSQLTAQKDTTSPDKVVAQQINKPNFAESTPLSIQTDKVGATLPKKAENEPEVLASNTDKNNEPDVQTDVHSGLSNIGYSQIANSTANVDKNHSMFDDAGNIKGERTGPDILGIALGMTDNPVKTATSPNTLLTVAILSAILIFFIVKKQYAYSLQTDAAAVPSNFSGSTGNERVIEVDQKMDGTVVLYLQEKEFKLCKPELDSESDQFIERLMELSSSDVKEIDYDKSYDENVRLSTPLSKLVTRLGFVGIKRNLFFPRTSKNKVLFRRYLTEQDLTSMNLSSSEISKELLQ